MRFTDEQVKQLHQKGREIQKYIEENIAPYARDTICVGFGNLITRDRFAKTKETEFCLYIEKNKIYGKQGGLTLFFDFPIFYIESCGGIDIFKDEIRGCRFIYALCLEWTSIKMVMNTTVEKWREEDKKVFENFSI